MNVSPGCAFAGGCEEVKFGEGQLLKTVLKWAPFIAGLFGVTFPPRPDFTSEEVREPVVGGAL